MTDLEIRYPSNYDILPFTTTVSISVGDNINALRESILNIENTLGLNINIGLFTADPTKATLGERLDRIERGIAERNLIFREINVSDSLQVLLNPNNQPFVRIGLSTPTSIAPVTIVGPLTILSPQVANPETIIQTPVKIDVTTFNPNASANSSIKGRSNSSQPLLTIEDINSNPASTEFALSIKGNVKVTGKLEAEYSIDHTKLLNTDTVPTSTTRGIVKHVTQGDYHSHRKGRYDSNLSQWIVDSTINTTDYGILSHSDLEDIGTLPTHGNDFRPVSGTAYHVTGGDLHSHKSGDGAQIDHNDLSNISPKFSNHVTGGDSHAHTSANDGGQVSHNDLADIQTTGTAAIHVTGGDLHSHALDSDGNLVGNGAQINHLHLTNIATTGAGSLHVTGGDAHKHSSDGDGGQIDHTTLSNIGTMTHDEIESKIGSFRATKTGTAQFTTTAFSEVSIIHGMGTDQFNVSWSLSDASTTPPSDPSDVGVIYVSNKTSSAFKFKRVGGLAVGPAVQAQYTTNLTAITNNDIQFVAKTAGIAGNSIHVQYILDSTISSNAVIYTTTSPASLTVRYKTSITKAKDIITAVNSNAAAVSLVGAFNASSNSGDGYISTTSGSDGYLLVDAYLSGGLDVTGFTGLDLEWIAVSKT